MKKILRYVSLILTLLIVCFTFCGCDELDEMRKTHAVWVDKEQTTILLNGKEYKLLPECEYFAPMAYNYISLTESDVPLLLAERYSKYYATISQDKDFIVVDPYDGYTQYMDKESETKYYCVSERYDEIYNRITGGNSIEYYCYEYDEYSIDAGYVSKNYQLTEEQTDAVLTVLDCENTVVTLYDNRIDHNISLYMCSEDMLFKKYCFDLVFMDSKAYFVFDYGTEINQPKMKIVPDELYPTFREIASKYIESMEER